MRRQPGLAFAAVGVLLLLGGTAGCSGPVDPDASDGTSSRPSTGSDTTTTPTPAAPPPPRPPVVAEGPCPYLEQGFVEETIGQRLERVETITVDGQPAPDCIFYRPDETVAVSIDLTPYVDPVTAQNAALALVTPAALPVTDLGDYGGILISSRQTLLAVTAGPLLVALTSNQESSLQARELGATVLAVLAPA
ncbi:MAG: DUF2020 domain-containing protein [Geodermatophilaceae bacterium]|nr:DUF2020 domain-containing protein [Geodermatophilaceae bacterium]